MLIKIWPGGWIHKLESMNMKVNDDNGKAVGMANGQARKYWQFSSNKYFGRTLIVLFQLLLYVLGGLGCGIRNRYKI